MLILGVLSLFVGLLVDPFWLVMGSPAILTLFVYIGVRIVLWWRWEKLSAERFPEDRQLDPLETVNSASRDRK